jgi:hypothetical protein
MLMNISWLAAAPVAGMLRLHLSAFTEAYFLATLDLDDAAIVHDDLDRTVLQTGQQLADALQNLRADGLLSGSDWINGWGCHCAIPVEWRAQSREGDGKSKRLCASLLIPVME